MLTSCICNQAQLESPPFQFWAGKLGQGSRTLHRKVWDWCYICQALYERRMLTPGKRGLGFAVGNEPLPSLFCSLGAEVVATDLKIDDAEKAGWWVKTDQHADTLEQLNARGICDVLDFARLCSFRYVDMNAVPDDLRGFDFIWSSCALEHLGTLTKGAQFIYNAMACLKPGGVAVHTTEYNVSSNESTIFKGGVSVYRKQDIELIADTLRQVGHKITVNYTLGELPADKFIDVPPYKQDPHLKLELGEYVITTIGLIIEKRGE